LQKGTFKGKWSGVSRDDHKSKPSTISGVNRQEEAIKQEIYTRLIPDELIEKFQIPDHFQDPDGKPLLFLNCPAGSSVTEMELYHQNGFRDPVLYGQISDTLNGQVHVMLYVLNDPNSERFDIDRLPNGDSTEYATVARNLPAELGAMNYGLAPGQVRRGLRMLGEAVQAFERFVESLDQQIYFVEPLFYHNAIIFERYGFRYAKGRRLMQRIQDGFAPGGDLRHKLDGSTPFRQPQAYDSIRLRSWAIHDQILGEIYRDVTMYKTIGQQADVNTTPGIRW
jgi:hypothetical protein